MTIYKTQATGSPSANGKFLCFDIHILVLRLNGEEFREVAMFHKRYKADVPDSSIVGDIWRRVENYAQVDGDRIAKEEIADRVESIAESLEDRSVEL